MRHRSRPLHPTEASEGSSSTATIGGTSLTQRHVARVGDSQRVAEHARLDAAWGIAPVQLSRDAHTGLGEAEVQHAAARGVSGSGGSLPHLEAIQRSFGPHDVSGVTAHVGGAARDASDAIGAHAYATGNHVAFAESPSLFLAAHEAAHVVQQRGGVQLSSAVGQAGDSYEQQADAVAARVVAGESAADLLGPSHGSQHATGVQRLYDKTWKRPDGSNLGVSLGPSTIATLDGHLHVDPQMMIDTLKAMGVDTSRMDPAGFKTAVLPHHETNRYAGNAEADLVVPDGFDGRASIDVMGHTFDALNWYQVAGGTKNSLSINAGWHVTFKHGQLQVTKLGAPVERCSELVVTPEQVEIVGEDTAIPYVLLNVNFSAVKNLGKSSDSPSLGGGGEFGPDEAKGGFNVDLGGSSTSSSADSSLSGHYQYKLRLLVGDRRKKQTEGKEGTTTNNTANSTINNGGDTNVTLAPNIQLPPPATVPVPELVPAVPPSIAHGRAYFANGKHDLFAANSLGETPYQELGAYAAEVLEEQAPFDAAGGSKGPGPVDLIRTGHYELKATGYASSNGTLQSNHTLSMDRAEQAAGQLTDLLAVESRPVGFGELQAAPTDRDADKRVDLKLTRKKDKL